MAEEGILNCKDIAGRIIEDEEGAPIIDVNIKKFIENVLKNLPVANEKQFGINTEAEQALNKMLQAVLEGKTEVKYQKKEKNDKSFTLAPGLLDLENVIEDVDSSEGRLIRLVYSMMNELNGETEKLSRLLFQRKSIIQDIGDNAGLIDEGLLDDHFQDINLHNYYDIAKRQVDTLRAKIESIKNEISEAEKRITEAKTEKSTAKTDPQKKTAFIKKD